jgi:hypothetical protein
MSLFTRYEYDMFIVKYEDMQAKCKYDTNGVGVRKKDWRFVNSEWVDLALLITFLINAKVT